jgi:phosphoglycolate phosphatase
MKIIFDLDGTLICSKKRLHELFCDLVNSRELDFPAYWDLKFNGYTNPDILREKFNYTGCLVDAFVNDWMSKIETSHYLSMDVLIKGSSEALHGLSQHHDLYICTARQSAEQAVLQVKNLGISAFFKQIFVTGQTKSKVELINGSGLSISSDDWFVGDTGHDVLAGKALNIKTCAVLSGFMSKEALKAYSPDCIISSISSLGEFCD